MTRFLPPPRAAEPSAEPPLTPLGYQATTRLNGHAALTCSCFVRRVLLWMSEETRLNWCFSASSRSRMTTVRLPHFPTRLYTTWLGNGSTCKHRTGRQQESLGETALMLVIIELRMDLWSVCEGTKGGKYVIYGGREKNENPGDQRKSSYWKFN